MLARNGDARSLVDVGRVVGTMHRNLLAGAQNSL